jgi:hypothetical protein
VIAGCGSHTGTARAESSRRPASTTSTTSTTTTTSPTTTTTTLPAGSVAFLVEIGQLDSSDATKEHSLSTGQQLCDAVRGQTAAAQAAGLSADVTLEATARNAKNQVAQAAETNASQWGGVGPASAVFTQLFRAALRDLCPEFAPVAAVAFP